MAEPVPVRREQEPARQRPGLWLDPFRDLSDLWDRAWRSMDWPMAPWATTAWRPPVDIEETDDAYVFEVELPGVKRDDIHVEIGDQELSITGELKERERVGVLRHRTRRTGSFQYRTSLPGGVDADRAEASYADGVLTVRVPRAEESKPRKIKVS